MVLPSKVSPLADSVPIVRTKDGTPTTYFVRQLEQLLDEKANTDDLAAGAIQSSDLTEIIEAIELDDLADVDLTTPAQGDILYRDTDANGWKNLAHGTSGQFLKTNGAGANPSWSTISSAASDAPALIPDLFYWYETRDLLASSGAVVAAMPNYSPSYGNSLFAGPSSSGTQLGPTVDSATLNSQPLINCAGTSASRFTWNIGTAGSAKFKTVTAFVVFKTNATITTGAFFGGAAGAFEFRLASTGPKLEILKSGTASIGTSTANLAINTAYQANVTYNDSTGAYAFRKNRAADGSGTTVQTITVNSGGVLWNSTTANEDLNAKVAALIIYNRVLTSGEITSVENYLNAKYGV